jgi:signal transduction histidine kinase/DNA-binding response OmpR family regulator
MGALMRRLDWSTTAVGPVDRWPQSLRTALSILLETGFPMYIAWGPAFTQFYNDGYRPILGSTKHPSAMGAGTRETFAEIWHIIGPMFAGVMQGTPTTVVDFMLPLDRHGFTEECYFIFSYSPIRQENGEVGGVLVTVTETTARVLGERRLKTSQALAARTRDAVTVPEACRTAAAVLGENAADLPFSQIYLVGPDGVLVLESECGDGPPATTWPLDVVLRSRQPLLVDVPAPAAAGAPRALVVPIVQQGRSEPIGVLAAGLSPRLMVDEGYRDFLTTTASQIGAAVASARALHEAKARADALAELDRAKTQFFNNVSHEFRTPLTLILGPVTDALQSADRTLPAGDLETIHRNAQRLLRLVNSLLDFSRIEAGRAEAVFVPTDLATLTADLASAFRSATERAGLDLVVDCAPLPAPVYVDRGMWEKVVLNLLSNAFKFTLSGSIAVRLAWRDTHVELTVQDTGVGIAPADLPHVFDRFHRVERAAARTHEGSGIGLALVRELVTMHGGDIRVTSVSGEGTTFAVTVPTGVAHLPPERLAPDRALAAAPAAATPYVQEALRWLPTPPAAAPASDAAASDHAGGRVLVADDNADMREYISRLLGGPWHVLAVADGAQALREAQAARPDVIVADVMMPVCDGFELLRALRADERTRSVPVILVSARAGEEARVEGLRAGADDYLVKPFSARELIARVQAQIVRGRVRSVEEAHTRRLAGIFEHAPMSVALVRGPGHEVEFVNDAFVAMTGGRARPGGTIAAAVPELAEQGIVDLLDDVYASATPYVGRSVKVNLRAEGGGAGERYFDFVFHPLDERGAVTGIAIICFDVTDLARARRDAEAASRAKDEFLAMLGHELRNPLAPILTALQLMRLRGVSGAERERTIIERQVRHVVGLVDDLLDVSRIARGKVQLRKQRLDVADVVTKAIEMTSPAIEERRHTIVVEVPRGLVVEGDQARLAQVFANLLTNAAKYTDPGGTIRISATREGDRAAVCVADTGTGIAPEILPRIFDLFTQERQDIDRSEGGLGLGLAIVHSLVQAHGGAVAAESQGKGRGATFTVRLPVSVTPPAELEAAPAAAAAGAGCRILLVDDNRDAADLLADSLRALGHAVHVVHDGPAALEAVRGDVPDVALLDLGLPVMDGIELAERLREDPRLHDVQLVAITGYGQEVDRRRTDAAGFAAHLVKPVDVHALDALLRQLRDGRARAS